MKIGVTMAGIGNFGSAARIARLRDRVLRETQSQSRPRDGAREQSLRDELDRSAGLGRRGGASGQAPLRSS
jgi:hypothetical protein